MARRETNIDAGTASEAAAGGQIPPAATGLEGLAQQAEQLQADAAGVTDLDVAEADGQGQVVKLSNAQIITGALGALRDMFCAVTGFQSPKKHLGDKEVEVLGVAWGAVADKHGLDLAALAGDYAAEIAAVVATAPIAIALHASVSAEMAARDKSRAPEQISGQAPATAPAAKPATVDEGVIRPAFAQ